MRQLKSYLENGQILAGRYLDEHGKPVQRTPLTHPYNYDGYVTYRGGKNEEIKASVWSDRLWQWDYKKYNELCQKHWENEGQNFYNRQPKEIQAFLQDYFNNPKIKLILVMQHCNQSSGYPVWRFDYHE